MTGTDEALRVEIWSDIVCPWCYIGKRRFERALAELDGELDVDVVYRPFQLDPTASPGSSMPVAEAYAREVRRPATGAGGHRSRHRDGRTRRASSSGWTAPCAPTRCSPTGCCGSPSRRARSRRRRSRSGCCRPTSSTGSTSAIPMCSPTARPTSGSTATRSCSSSTVTPAPRRWRTMLRAGPRRRHHGRADVRHRSQMGDPGRAGSRRVRAGAPPVRRQGARTRGRAREHTRARRRCEG